MTSEEKTLLVALTAVAVLVPVVLGAALGLPVWGWLLLVVALLAAPGLVLRNIQQRLQRERLREERVASAAQEEDAENQPQAQQTALADVALPSATDDYAFYFSATAYWHPIGGSMLRHANLAGLAADAIIARAKEIAATEQPSWVDVVAHRLVAELGAAQRDASGSVHAWADQVQLTLPEADQVRLRRLSDARKDGDVWERERDHERSKRSYLGDDVLKSTGSAVVWRLAQTDSDVEGTVRLIGTLAQLSAAANDAEVPELFRHLVPVPALPEQESPESRAGDPWFADTPSHDGRRETTGHYWADLLAKPFSNAGSVEAFGLLLDTLDLDDNQRAQVARRVATVIKAAGRPEKAEEIQRHFDSPAVDEEPVAVSDPGSEVQDRTVSDEEPPPPEEPWQGSVSPQEPDRDVDQQSDDQLGPIPLDEPRA